ncbi:hypothetical protein LINPERHAP2_LOCUS45166, partial [Linum perenne]
MATPVCVARAMLRGKHLPTFGTERKGFPNGSKTVHHPPLKTKAKLSSISWATLMKLPTRPGISN